MKVPYIRSSWDRHESYISIRLVYDQPFSGYCIFWAFPIDLHVKISKYHKILKSDRQNFEVQQNYLKRDRQEKH